MNTFAKLATAAAVAGALAVPMATPSQAAWHHHGDRGTAAAIGFGAGALVGLAVPLGIAGLFAGVVVGIVLVITRFRDL